MWKDDHMDDAQLLASCLQGNTEDFKVVIAKYRGKAMALAWGDFMLRFSEKQRPEKPVFMLRR